MAGIDRELKLAILGAVMNTPEGIDKLKQGLRKGGKFFDLCPVVPVGTVKEISEISEPFRDKAQRPA